MPASTTTLQELASAIRNIPDFPKPGIQFKDITPVLGDPRLFSGCVELLTSTFPAGAVDAVVGIEARGFIFAAAAAYRWQTAFVPVRKQGKLPSQTLEQSYKLEYGSNTLAIHADAIKPGTRVVLVDDLLATGGTAAAAAALLRRMDATILELSFFIELAALKGRQQLAGLPVRSLVVC